MEAAATAALENIFKGHIKILKKTGEMCVGA